VECLVSRARVVTARPAHSGRALQPGGRAGHRHLPQLLRQPRPHREDCQHGAVGECDCAHLSNDDGIFLQTIYHPLALFANNTKGKALQLFVDSPKYKTQRYDEVPYLDVSAALDNGQVVINAVNRHPDRPLEVDFELEDKSFSGAVAVSEVNGPDIKAENDFGKAPVTTATRSAASDGKHLRFTFAPHSYTMLKVKTA